jgi:hypothetical protein
MSQLSRRTFLAGATAAAAAVPAPRVHAQKSGGTSRFVAQADLEILDPAWTSADITRHHGRSSSPPMVRRSRTSSRRRTARTSAASSIIAPLFWNVSIA